MNRKILMVCFLTVMMLAITFSSATEQTIIVNPREGNLRGTTSELEIDNQNINGETGELPIWSVGDFWEYDLNITIIIGYSTTFFSINATRMDIIVVDDAGDEYTMEISGYLDKFKFNGLEYSPNASYISGIAHIDKSTLSMIGFELCLSGNGPLLDFDVVMNMGFDPELNFLDFPISIGDIWDIAPNIDIALNGNIIRYLFGNIPVNIPVEEEFLDISLSDKLEAVNNELIGVKAGEFEAFKISGELMKSSNLWYSPEAGYLARVGITMEFPNIFNFGCNLELLSTNFNYPEDNSAPNIPSISGPDNGKTGEEYEYIVSTTDPEGEQVSYKIDWGDGTFSDWIGPSASGEGVKVKHAWTNDATFNIRAKAKDINGYQTQWSNSMVVTMPVDAGAAAIPGGSATLPATSGESSSQKQQTQSTPSGSQSL